MKTAVLAASASSIREPIYLPRLRSAWFDHPISEWLAQVLKGGNRVLVPAIISY